MNKGCKSCSARCDDLVCHTCKQLMGIVLDFVCQYCKNAGINYNFSETGQSCICVYGYIKGESIDNFMSRHGLGKGDMENDARHIPEL